MKELLPPAERQMSTAEGDLPSDATLNPVLRKSSDEGFFEHTPSMLDFDMVQNEDLYEDSERGIMNIDSKIRSNVRTKRSNTTVYRPALTYRQYFTDYKKQIQLQVMWLWTQLATDIYALEELLVNANRVVIMGQYLNNRKDKKDWQKKLVTVNGLSQFWDTRQNKSQSSSIANGDDRSISTAHSAKSFASSISSQRSVFLDSEHSNKSRFDAYIAAKIRNARKVELPMWRMTIKKVARSLGYELTVWIYNILLAVAIFSTDQYSVDNEFGQSILPESVEWINMAFFVWLLVDVMVKVTAFGRSILQHSYDLLDITLVVVVTLGVISSIGDHETYRNLRIAFMRLMVLRVIRLFRITLWLRTSLFITPWIILNCVLYTSKVIFWGTAFGLLLLYCGSIFLRSFIGPPYLWYAHVFTNQNYGNLDGMNMGIFVDEMHGTTGKSIYSLFVVLTLSWIEGCIPIATYSNFTVIILFFLIVIVVMSFGYLNLVIAIVVKEVRKVYLENEILELKVVHSRLQGLQRIIAEHFDRPKYLTLPQAQYIIASSPKFRNILQNLGFHDYTEIPKVFRVICDHRRYLMGNTKVKTTQFLRVLPLMQVNRLATKASILELWSVMKRIENELQRYTTRLRQFHELQNEIADQVGLNAQMLKQKRREAEGIYFEARKLHKRQYKNAQRKLSHASSRRHSSASLQYVIQNHGSLMDISL